ncbi:MAG: SPOR domain-containing protein [Bacteroidaceae bacterium]|nr:SPOR domain-containing protein [Bacteroidaceae bacterium]
MKHSFVLGAALCVALAMVSCRSSESAYKKAYDKAKSQQTAAQVPTQQQTTAQPTTVAPVQTVTTTTTVATNETARTENVTLVSGAGLKAYSVVVGSFGVKANAENLQSKLKAAGYAAQIASNPNGMFRVIASTFDDLNSAVQSRNTLRSQYQDAWLLRK